MAKNSKELQNFLVKRFNVEHKCVACDSTNNLTIDHIFPKCKGGLDNVLNMQIMCHTHNNNKGKYIDYSHEYVKVKILGISFFSDIIKYNENLGRNYIKKVIQNCIGIDAYSKINYLSIKDYEYFVEFLGLYGIKVEINARGNYIPKQNSKFLCEMVLNYIIPKHTIKQYLIK